MNQRRKFVWRRFVEVGRHAVPEPGRGELSPGLVIAGGVADALVLVDEREVAHVGGDELDDHGEEQPLADPRLVRSQPGVAARDRAGEEQTGGRHEDDADPVVAQLAGDDGDEEQSGTEEERQGAGSLDRLDDLDLVRLQPERRLRCIVDRRRGCRCGRSQHGLLSWAHSSCLSGELGLAVLPPPLSRLRPIDVADTDESYMRTYDRGRGRLDLDVSGSAPSSVLVSVRFARGFGRGLVRGLGGGLERRHGSQLDGLRLGQPGLGTGRGFLGLVDEVTPTLRVEGRQRAVPIGPTQERRVGQHERPSEQHAPPEAPVTQLLEPQARRPGGGVEHLRAAMVARRHTRQRMRQVDAEPVGHRPQRCPQRRLDTPATGQADGAGMVELGDVGDLGHVTDGQGTTEPVADAGVHRRRHKVRLPGRRRHAQRTDLHRPARGHDLVHVDPVARSARDQRAVQIDDQSAGVDESGRLGYMTGEAR